MTYVLCEIASAHDGSLTKMKELVHAAAESGADGVKFQVFTANEIPKLKHLVFDEEQWAEIMVCVPESMHLWCEVFGTGGMRIAKDYAQRWKLPKGCRTPDTPNVWMKNVLADRTIWGIQDYPTTVETAKRLIRRAGGEWGYADHSGTLDGLYLALSAMAIQKGATLIEKHLRMDDCKSKDAVSALRPLIFNRFVEDVRSLSV